MASQDIYDTQLDEQQQRNFVLKQPSTVGPWVALGLGVTIIAFVGYLIYTTMVLPAPLVTPIEQTSRGEIDTASGFVRAKRPGQRSTERRKASTMVLPQEQAPHALLGGQGPALPPEQTATPWLRLP